MLRQEGEQIGKRSLRRLHALNPEVEEATRARVCAETAVRLSSSAQHCGAASHMAFLN